MPQIGDQILHFEILSPLGKGGMGQVFRAKDTKLDREVALKFLLADTNNEELKDRLVFEAKSVARLDHPNIGTLHAIEEFEDELFLVMALYEGEDLAFRLEKGPLEVNEALGIFDQLLAGLGYAHDRGIIHRDLKPANILITTEGLVKVLDFGLAKSKESDLTKAGQYLGTPRYSSPEHLKSGGIDQRSDIWSLGVLLFQILTGALPFDGTTPQVLTAVLQGKPAIDEHLHHQGLKIVIHKCLQLDKAKRYASCQEFAKALTALKDSQSTNADSVLKTLGQISLQGSDFSRHRPLLLLAFLAIEGSQERGHLADLFFPGNAKARSNLSVQLSRLRQISPEFIESDDVRVWTNVKTDAQELLEAFSHNDFIAVTNIYQGRFFEGLNVDDLGTELAEWVQRTRDYLAGRAQQAQLHLAEHEASQGQYNHAAQLAEDAYKLAPARAEPTTLQRLHALFLAANHHLKADLKEEAGFYDVSLFNSREEAREHLQSGRALSLVFNLENPYRGLAYFREEDAEFFYGREVIAKSLLEHVKTKPLLSIIGSSGSGKSSLVFAGIIPKLRAENWLVLTLRPGLAPFQALASSLLVYAQPELDLLNKQHEVQALSQALKQGDESLVSLITLIKKKHPEQDVLIVIDQFEELYTFSEAESGHPTNFLDQLIELINSNNAALIMTLRADFMAKALEYRPMLDLLQDYQFLLGGMSNSELREVIVAPAVKQGASFEEGLVERILADVTTSQGNLPLLEFTLTSLWEAQSKGVLTHQAYESTGGIEQALTRHAESVYEKLSEREKETIERVFLQLIYPGAGQEDTRRVANHHEIGNDWSIVHKLSSAPARLLVTSQDGEGNQTAEIIHEALIRNWQTLRGWIDEHRNFRTWQEHLRSDVRRWLDSGDKGYLLRGFPLDEAKEQLKDYRSLLGEDELNFINASVDLEKKAIDEQTRRQAEEEQRRLERERLRQRFTQAVSAALVVAVILAILAGWQWRVGNQQRQLAEDQTLIAEQQRDIAEEQQALAEEQRDEAQKQRVIAEEQRLLTEEQRLLATFRGLEGQALAAIQNDEYTLSSLLTAQGLKMTRDNAENRKNFLTVMLALPSRITASFRDEHQSRPYGLEVSPDGTMIAIAGQKVTLWDVNSLSLIGVITAHEQGDTRDLAFSPDSKMLVTSGEDTTIKLWDVATLNQVGKTMTDNIPNPEGDGDGVYGVAFSPDGKLVASAGQDHTVIFWDVATQEMIGEPLEGVGDALWYNNVAFSPDGKILASTELCCAVHLWDVESQTQVADLWGHTNSVDGVTFSPDGKLLATSGWDQQIILWDVEAKSMIGEPFSAHSAGIQSIAFSPDGKTLYSASADKTIASWDVETQTLLGEPLRGHEAGVRRMALLPDGNTLVSIGIDSTVLLWDLSDSQRLSDNLATDHWVKDIAINPDASTFVTGSWAGTIRLWDVEEQKMAQEVQAGQSHLNDLAYSPDGSLIVSNSTFKPWSIRFWDAQTLEQIGEPLVRNDGVILPWEVAFHPDGSMFASGAWSGEEIVLWDAASLTVVGEPLQGHTDMIMDMAFSPDGEIIASSANDSTIRMWDVASQSLIGIIDAHNGSVNSIAFNPEGTILASGSEDETVMLWDVASQTLIGSPFNGHKSVVNTVAFSPDGKVLASGGEGDGVLFWDVASGEPIAYPYQDHTDGMVGGVAFSPDDSYFVSGGKDIIIWKPRPEPVGWLTRACQVAGRNFTLEEWQTYMGDLPYEVTCQQFPSVLTITDQADQ